MQKKRPGLVISSDASDSFFANLEGSFARHACSEEDACKMAQEACKTVGVAFASRPMWPHESAGCYPHLNEKWGLWLSPVGLECGFTYELAPGQILLVARATKWQDGEPVEYRYSYYDCHGAQTRAEYEAYLERTTALAGLPASGTRLTGDWWDDSLLVPPPHYAGD